MATDRWADTPDEPEQTPEDMYGPVDETHEPDEPPTPRCRFPWAERTRGDWAQDQLDQIDPSRL